jgi:hypothetical protein
MQTIPGVTYEHVVPTETLEQELGSARVLINPAEPIADGNPLNFPSKVQDYLRLGPPVVSTICRGLSPAYRKLVYGVEDVEHLETWVGQIRAAVAEGISARNVRVAKAEAFMAENSWARKAVVLKEWLQNVYNETQDNR